MDTATIRTPALQLAVFEDGLGKRHHAIAPSGEPLELLEVRADLSTTEFELALRERVAVLAGLQSTCFSRIRGAQRLEPLKLIVLSDRVPGERLSTLLAGAREKRVPLDLDATLCLIRQLVSAIALLHEKLPGIAHGAISPERVVITPKARLVVADHGFGSAIEQLRYSPDRYWKELRVPLPRAAHARFDQPADVMQIGIVALELMLGRPIEREEYPDRIDELTERAWRFSATGRAKPLPAELRAWLLQMLWVDTHQAFESAADAWTELERVLGANHIVASFDALESFMSEYARTTMPGIGLTTPGVAVSPPIAPAMPVAAPSAPPLAVAPAAAPAAVTPSRPAVVAAAVVAPAAAPPMAAAPAVAPPMAAAPAFAPPLATPPVFAAAPPEINRTKPSRRRWIAAAAVLLLLAGGGALFGRRYLVPPAAAEATGTLVVNTNPAGIPVIVDGHPRGVTPVTMELAPGSHELKLAGEGQPRIIPVTITAGSTVAQTIELPKPAAHTGQLVIQHRAAGCARHD